MYNLLRNIIRLGNITKIFNRFGIIRSQVTCLDTEGAENVINLHPYGFNACPPINSQIVTFMVYGHAENKYGIPYNPTDADIQRLQSGESVIYNHVGSIIYLKSNGDIDIIPNGNNVNIQKDLNVSGVYKVDDIQVVTSQQPSITNPTGGATVDAEARTAVISILTALRTHGLIQT